MRETAKNKWKDRIVSPETVIEKIKPGMSIFLGTGAAEPRTLVKNLMSSDSANLQDLELIQIVSFGDAISLKKLRRQKYRLKTFFSGWVAEEAITEGQVDLIPSRFAWIPKLIESGQISINVAFIQITPPDKNGNCSLGVAVDVARQAIDQASLVVGEVNSQIPRTYGDTFIHISDFNLLVNSTQEPIYFDRWPVSAVFEKIAANVTSLIEDGTCIAFSIGPLFEALGRHLIHKRHLGVHSPFFTDALMDLVTSGAVSNRYKEIYRGKSLASYALGTPKLMSWLDQNPLIEFQGIDKVFNPSRIGRNPRFVAVLPARKVDLTGRIALQIGKGNIATGPAEVLDFFHGAELSAGGCAVFAIPSRNRNGKPNIRVSVEEFPNQFSLRESIDMVISEYGVASLKGCTIRQRAQALIDIAHPDDRPELIDNAKAQKIIYQDQIYLAESAHLYPAEITTMHTFKGSVKVRFRAIKPSDEEEMRRLFYRFSDMAVYARYFGHIAAMPHTKTQEYVNVDWNDTMSIVGLIDEPGHGRIIAEARFIKEPHGPCAEIVFVVDEKYQSLGIGTYLYKMLTLLAKERGVQGFTADVLFSNIGMMKIFRKGELSVKAVLENGVYHLTILFDDRISSFGSNIH
ncbi:MAG: GNAT family N-acetyltransferase [Deltaproteobacteria bacterium]|nr:GNAT family N-acetyltransferase [Deltaproteobacteria bacterium]